LHWINAADTKAAFVFTLDTAMLGVLASFSSRGTEAWAIGTTVLIFITVALLLPSLLFVSFATFPRTDGPKRSLIYFGGICSRDLNEYKKDSKSLTEDDYIEDLTAQCHQNAVIANNKFFWVQFALLLMYLSVVPWGLAVYLLFGGE
jgi:hypothetical protein